MKPRYSIIVPLYNKASYVKKALESICTQTYRDYEVLIVDDGSTDNSLEVVKEYVERIYDRWIADRLTIINQPNSGVAAARNVGVENSHGEYLCFLDADDWWHPTFLEEVDKLIKEYPNAGLYVTNYIYYKTGKTRIALNLPNGLMDYSKAYVCSDMMPVTSITVAMPRDVFTHMGGFPIGIALGEDFLLWTKISFHYLIAYTNKALAHYNNDVPVNSRAIKRLHKPEYHMLWHVSQWETEEKTNAAYKAMIDMLRVNGLLPYWLSDEYHDAAAAELAKVDWSKQPKSIARQYKLPIAFIKAKHRILHIGSYFKQILMRIL